MIILVWLKFPRLSFISWKVPHHSLRNSAAFLIYWSEWNKGVLKLGRRKFAPGVLSVTFATGGPSSSHLWNHRDCYWNLFRIICFFLELRWIFFLGKLPRLLIFFIFIYLYFNFFFNIDLNFFKIPKIIFLRKINKFNC